MYHDTIIKVRYAETDQMGIVYHANYLVWFEIGRTEFLENLGYSYKELEENGIMLPVIEANCRYFHRAQYCDNIIIRTCIDYLEGARIKFSYEGIKVVDGTTIVKGSTTHAITDRNLRPIRLRKVEPKLYEILKNTIRSE